MATLDRKKPYGEVHGENVPHRYEQDGKCFGQDGEEIVEKQATVKAEPTAKAAKQATVKAEPDSQVDAQLAG
jgi:hypothetical protein